MDVMLCKDDRKAFCRYVNSKGLNIYESIKLDGVRCLAEVDLYTMRVRYISRSGKPLPNFECFDEGLVVYAKHFAREHDMKDTVVTFDSEVTSTDESFKKLMQNLRRLKGADASIFQMNIMDIPTMRRTPFFYRRSELSKLMLSFSFPNIKLLAHTPVTYISTKTIASRLEEVLALGHEGLVYKNAFSLYIPGKSRDWLKVKDAQTVDLEVTGSKPGKGKYGGLVGALLCDFKGVEIAVSGFTYEQRREFTVDLPRLIEVEYQSITSKGSLRHPRFVCVREDKVEHD